MGLDHINLRVVLAFSESLFLPQNRIHTMDREKRKHWGLILIFAAIFISLILLMELCAHLMESADPPWTGFWPVVVHIVKIIGEGGVVACIIGVIIEISHFRRFYESIIRRFLTDEEYLEKFKVSTLDSIFQKCYVVRNRNEITNDLHEWQSQFDFAWKDLKDLPTKAYRSNYTHTIEYYFYSKDEVPEETKFSENGFDLNKLNQEFVIIEDTIKYDLVSPYIDKPYPYTVATAEVLTPFENNSKSIDNKKCLIYELEIDGKPVELREGDHYSVKKVEGGLEFSLDYEIDARPAMHISVTAYSVEPVVEDFYCYYSRGAVLDKQKVYFRSNVQLAKLDYVTWFPSEVPRELKELEKTQKSLTFSYNTWVFPGAGFVIVWQR